MKKRGDVWLGAGAIVVNERGELLVVEKEYGGLKGLWSFPAGFVDKGETVDEAAIREVKEETGIDCRIEGVCGVRTGVLANDVSDNLVLFFATPLAEGPLERAIGEIRRVAWLTPEELLRSAKSAAIVVEFCHEMRRASFAEVETFHPGKQFGYQSYKLFKA